MRNGILFVVGREIANNTSIAATETEKRCKKALKEWNRGGYTLLLVSALEYEPGGGEPISASGLMADWFVAQGISRRQIFVEGRARDIYDNVQMGWAALNGQDPRNRPMTVVTEFFNAVRCWILFLLLYRKWTSVRPMFKWLPFGRLVRELMIVVYLFYDPRGIKRIARGNREMKKSELI